MMNKIRLILDNAGQPVEGVLIFPVVVSNMQELTNEQIEKLDCGSTVIKEDESGKHAYIVTFRSATGICMSYFDATCVETVSYDLVEGQWTYNSTDVGHLSA